MIADLVIADMLRRSLAATRATVASMYALPVRPPRDTGPLELRDFSPTGRRLGTPADCYDGSTWELHRGELWEQMGCKDIHGIVMALLTALFRTHARAGITVMADVYCDLSDATTASVRAPDVVLVGDLSTPRNENYTGTPILAVEVRGTQSTRYLEEKVKLYLEHNWPCTWIVYPERQEVEVLRPNVATVVYTLTGTAVPLVPELDQHGLATLPVAAVFDEVEARWFNDGWVEVRERANALLELLDARGLAITEQTRARVLGADDIATLRRWFLLAATAATGKAFALGMRKATGRRGK